MKDFFNLGILSSMPEELGSILTLLNNVQKKDLGDLVIYKGKWTLNNTKDFEINVILAWSGWGKVSASRATTRIICEGENSNFPIDLLIFTGVAGSASALVDQNDLVIADSVIQHDMDAEPLFRKFVIPAFSKDIIFPKKEIISWALNSFIKNQHSKDLSHIRSIQKGLIATGDNFITDKEIIKNIKNYFPKLIAVEMEGAAFAQVALQEKINWLLIRVISDNANNDADLDFKEFLEKYQNNSVNTIKCIINSIPNYPLLSTNNLKDS